MSASRSGNIEFMGTMSRQLSIEEQRLTRWLLSKAPEVISKGLDLESVRVLDSGEGGYRSVIFPNPKIENLGSRKLGTYLVEAEFFDEDGVLVRIALNTDFMGMLYELDIFRVDYAPIRNFPKDLSELRFLLT